MAAEEDEVRLRSNSTTHRVADPSSGDRDDHMALTVDVADSNPPTERGKVKRTPLPMAKIVTLWVLLFANAAVNTGVLLRARESTHSTRSPQHSARTALH